MEKKDVFKKLDRINDLPALPAIAMEVNRLLRDYNTSINELADKIEKDQAITAKILKLVNSSFFGFRAKIGNIRHAVSLLGFNTVRNAVVSVAIIDAFAFKKTLPEFDSTDFWKHALAVAMTSKYLAEKTRLHAPDDCFVGGLLHDMGKIVIAQYFSEDFKRVFSLMQKHTISFAEAEKSEMVVGHAEIGAYLAERWHLPKDLIDTIRFHHQIKKSASCFQFSVIVYLANRLVNVFRFDSPLAVSMEGLPPEIVTIIKDNLDLAPEWFPAVAKEIDQACQFFLEGLKT
jgi:putative nucleotidyltransferase with HDIG domain